MNVLVLDDDNKILETLKLDFQQHFKYFNEKINFELKSSDFLNYKFTDIDIAFIDIDLVKYNGINIAHHLNQKFPNIVIIFISAREDLVFETLKTKMFQFIRKRKYEEDKELVFSQLDEYFENYSNRKIIDCKGRKLLIQLDKIKYILSIGHDVVIAENSQIIIKSSLKSILDYLNSSNLVQIQRTMVVNLKYCLSVKNSKVVTMDKKEYVVGRKYQQNLIEKYEEFLLR